MGRRARQVKQNDLSDDEKCEGGICKSNDTHWTNMCTKHRTQHDEISTRWNHQHVHGLDSPLTGEALAKYMEEYLQ